MTTKPVLPGCAPASLERTARVFALSEILPEGVRIVFDERSHTAFLLNMENKETTPLLHACPLTPSAARVFLALLQAYPQHCSYQSLLTCLYPTSPEGPSSAWERHVRPIRRALVALTPALRAFGLEVVALRRHGYLLAPAPHLSEATGGAS